MFICNYTDNIVINQQQDLHDTILCFNNEKSKQLKQTTELQKGPNLA